MHSLNHTVPCYLTTKVPSTRSNTINVTKATINTCFISGFIITLFYILLLLSNAFYSVFYIVPIYSCHHILSYLFILCWLHWFLNRCAFSHMTLISNLVGVASNYTVHVILASNPVRVAYDHTIYHFDCYTLLLEVEGLVHTNLRIALNSMIKQEILFKVNNTGSKAKHTLRYPSKM